MRQICLIIACFFFFNCYSQTDSVRLDYSPYGQTRDMLDADMNALAYHKKLTQFTYFDMNYVNERLEDFFSGDISLVQSGEPIYDMSKPDKYISQKYVKSIQYNPTKSYFINVKYNLFTEGSNFIIKSCEISGYWIYILDLYVKYWADNSLHFEAAKKGELVVYYLLQDKIVLSLNPTTETGKIVITNTTINSIDQYNEIIKKNQIQYLKQIEEKKQIDLKKAEEARELTIKKEIEEKKKQEEKLNAFLLERKTTVYNLSEINIDLNDSIKTNIIKVINDFIANSKQSQYSIKGDLKVMIDTNNVVTYDTLNIKTDNQEQLKLLTDKIKSNLKFKTQILNGYSVNSFLICNIDLFYFNGQVFFKIDKTNKIVYQELQPSTDIKTLINQVYSKNEKGKYEIKIEYSKINGNQIQNSNTIIKYKKPFKFPYYMIGIAALVIAGALGLQI